MSKNRSIENYISTIIFVVIFVTLCILFGFNTNNVDYINYQNAYNQITSGEINNYFGTVFTLIIKLSGYLKLSYQQFLIAISVITIFILVIGLKKITNRINITLLLFMIYPFVFDIVQYRNFLAYAICLYGIHFLLKDSDEIKNLCLFIIFVIIGSSIHSSMVIYLSFILIKIKNYKYFLLSIIIIFSTIIVFSINNNLLESTLKLLGLDSFLRYEVDGSISTFLQYFVVYVALLILSLLKFNFKFKSNRVKILIVIIIFIPFILLNGTSARFFRNLFVLFYAFILNSNDKNELTKRKIIINERFIKNMFVYTCLLTIVISVFINQLTSGLYYDTVLKPIIENNLLW